MSGPKSFDISKHAVMAAWEKVRANKGGAGIDDVSIMEFEQDLKGNLYKLWNRMSSGSYFPPPVRMVEIPKPGSDQVRVLGVPTVADRVAQTVVAMHLEPEVEPVFHPDSYGYRPRRNALDAVGVCRQRCWSTDWVIDLDIQGFFDNLDHDLILKAVEHHSELSWVVLYIRRWLTAGIQRPDGSVDIRDRGSPQGSAISPLLANLFMHYAFDMFVARQFPRVKFERYCDDVVVHCGTQAEATHVLEAIRARLLECGGLLLHPEKTRIVYCKDEQRRAHTEHDVAFMFLGYEFRSRLVRLKTGRYFFGFNPAMSKSAGKQVRARIRAWRLHRRTQSSLADLARAINPIVGGWINYYGAFRPSELGFTLNGLNHYLMRWLMQKYKRFRRHQRRAWEALRQAAQLYPGVFVHWRYIRP